MEVIVKEIKDNKESLKEFQKELEKNDNKEMHILLHFPTVYIHKWDKDKKYGIYIGETNNIIKRTKEHYQREDKEEWPLDLNKDSKLYIIGHDHFNKSLTLDIENRLMQYALCLNENVIISNLKGNPQDEYYPVEELDSLFTNIWNKLRKYNKDIFLSEKYIKESAVYKASPLLKLKPDQLYAQEKIIARVKDAINNDKYGQLIFVEGEAGTGKTVVNSSTFYELICEFEKEEKNIKPVMMVNHDQQVLVYDQIAERLGLKKKYYEDIVCKPTHFINTYTKDDKFDVAFVDEGHLLLTQGKQAYRGKNQLEDIIERARVTIVMFDKNQILTTEQYWEYSLLEKYKKLSIDQGNYIELKDQKRIDASKETINWIDCFTKDHLINQIPKDVKYEIRIFNTPEELEKAIKEKNNEVGLSRLIATYDWNYKNDKNIWEVEIDKWHKPWNYVTKRILKFEKKYINKIRNLAWAEQPHTIDEVGSTFTIQGFDLNYAGLIIGESVKFEDGKIVFKSEESKSYDAIKQRTLSNGKKQKFAEELLNHELRVLMTRGVKGIYIYACDKNLRDELLKSSNELIKLSNVAEEYPKYGF